MNHPYRTDGCGALRDTDTGRTVRLTGWVINIRPLGKLAFATVRDGTGLVQLVARTPDAVAHLQRLRPGAVVTADGQVERRRARDVNPRLRTGTVEVAVTAIRERPTAVVPDLSAPLGDEAGSVPGARAESLVRDYLIGAGFVDLGEGLRGPLPEILARHERLFWTHTTGGAAGHRRLARVASVFVTFDDLRAQVRDVLHAMAPALPSPAGTLLADVPATAPGPRQPSRFRILHGLPVTGLPGLDGHDRGLTLLSEPVDGPPAPEGTSHGELAQCLLLAVGGRIVGAGGVRHTDPGALLHDYPQLLDADPFLAGQVHALAQHQGAPLPGEAWFAVDLDGFTRLVPVEDRPATPRADPVPFPDVPAAVRDLTTLLRGAEVTSPNINGADGPGQAGAQRVERWDVEASAAMARSRTASTPAPAQSRPAGHGSTRTTDADGQDSTGRKRNPDGPDDPWAGYRDLLDDFSMDAEVRDRLLDAVPGAAHRMARMSGGERFTWVWSVLGNQRVRDLLRNDQGLEVVRRASRLGVLTDAGQLSYLDLTAARHLSTVWDRYGDLGEPGPDSRSGLVNALRNALAATPGSVTALLAALTEADDDTAKAVHDVLSGGHSDRLVAAAHTWLAAPGVLPLALRAAGDPAGLDHLGVAARTAVVRALPNVPTDAVSVAGAFLDQAARRVPALAGILPSEVVPTSAGELATGVLHHVFRPISLTYTETRTVLEHVGDQCAHLPDSGLVPGGRHWSPGRGCYEFAHVTGPGALRCYPSKNAASALAKGSVGICTAQDLDLYRRPDHHHLNLLDPAGGVIVGNAQLHILNDGPARVLLIRAVNASNTYLARHPARAVLEAVLLSGVELAASSGLDEVRLGAGLSFWHLNSSRPQLRAVLEDLYDVLPAITLQRPFFLFRFGRVDLELTTTYRLWTRHPEQTGGVGLHHIIRTIT